MTTININVQATLQWAATQTARGRWIAECAPLGIVLEADSLDELNGVINEATHLLFADLVADNEFDQFLRERGWSASRPPDARQADIGFNVPMELVARLAADGSSHRAH